MGNIAFWIRTSGANANEVFATQVEAARSVFGTGHTGTIADKDSFRPEGPRDGETAEECVRRCTNDASHWSADVLAPAAFVDAGPDPDFPGLRIYYFFGLAFEPDLPRRR